MILVRNYIEGMPDAIFESAKIGGANDLVIFFRMILPLSKPIIMTIALFVAIMHLNSWFDAYLYTNSQNLKVMQSILVEILNQYQTAGDQTRRQTGRRRISRPTASVWRLQWLQPSRLSWYIRSYRNIL